MSKKKNNRTWKQEKIDLSVTNENTFNDNLGQRVVSTTDIHSNLVENHIEIYRGRKYDVTKELCVQNFKWNFDFCDIPQTKEY